MAIEGDATIDDAASEADCTTRDDPRTSAAEDSSAQVGEDPVAPAGEGSALTTQESALTAQENAVLDLEETWWTRGRNKTEAIATIGMAPTRYYLLLNRILANPQARMERPELVGRLLRLRQRRAEERRMGNVPPGDVPAG